MTKTSIVKLLKVTNVGSAINWANFYYLKMNLIFHINHYSLMDLQHRNKH